MGIRNAGDGVDPADLSRLALGERRQQPSAGARKERLADARGPDEGKVVASGDRDLQCPTPDGLADHGCEVRCVLSRG